MAAGRSGAAVEAMIPAREEMTPLLTVADTSVLPPEKRGGVRAVRQRVAL
jgi:hypothetical protein